MSQAPGMPSPTPEHERLHAIAGHWDVAATLLFRYELTRRPAP